MITRRGAIPILWLACAWCAPVWAAPTPSTFSDGVAAFRAGRYSEALRFFLLVQGSGQTTAQLLHNLGVTHYRLGDYASAGASFQALIAYPDAAPLARYNLGLVALKLGRSSQARAEFEQAARTAPGPELRALANQQLQSLPSPPVAPAAPVSPVSLYLHIASGYEDNVALSSETSLIPPAQRASWFSQVLAAGHLALGRDWRQGWWLTGAAYRTAYPEATRYSLNSLRLGPQYRARYAGMQTEASLSAVYLTLGGEHFETIARALARADYPLSRTHTLAAAYQYEYIRGGGEFTELDGSRHSLNLDDRWVLGPAELSLGYRLELNRRRDFSTPARFSSTSPTRHRGSAELRLRLTPSLRAALRLEYEQSHYNNPDRFERGGLSVSVSRFDQRTSGQAGLSWVFSRQWELAAEYRSLIRESNIAGLDYLSSRYELRLEHRF